MPAHWVAALSLLCCHLMLTTGSNTLMKDDHYKPSKKPLPIPKPGHFVNCGDPKTEASASVQPEKVRFGDTMTINVSILSPVDLKEGYLNVSIYIGEETEPMYQTGPGEGHFNCNDIHKYFRLLCPFRKNERIGIKGFKFPLSPSLGVPSGDFRIRLEVQDVERNTAICTYGHLVILDD